METLSLEQVKAYQGEYKVVPICRSIYADVRTPIEVLRIVKNISSHCYLLESMEDSQRWAATLSSAMTRRWACTARTARSTSRRRRSPDPYGPSGTAHFPDPGR